MQKNEPIARYASRELDDMLARGVEQTDRERLDAMTEEDLEASIDRAEAGEID